VEREVRERVHGTGRSGVKIVDVYTWKHYRDEIILYQIIFYLPHLFSFDLVMSLIFTEK